VLGGWLARSIFSGHHLFLGSGGVGLGALPDVVTFSGFPLDRFSMHPPPLGCFGGGVLRQSPEATRFLPGFGNRQGPLACPALRWLSVVSLAQASSTSFTMPITLATIPVMQAFGDEWGDCKRELSIHPEHTCDVDGEKFLWCTPHWYALVQFVVVGAPGLCGRGHTKLSLTSSFGLRELLRLRNEAAWPATTAVVAQSLFQQAAVVEPRPKKPRKRQPDASVTVEIQLPAVADLAARPLRVKRPSHPCERLAVPLDTGALQHILLYIHMSGFDLQKKQKVAWQDIQEKPAGAWFNKQRAVWMVPTGDGKRWRTCRPQLEPGADAEPCPVEDGEVPVADEELCPVEDGEVPDDEPLPAEENGEAEPTHLDYPLNGAE